MRSGLSSLNVMKIGVPVNIIRRTVTTTTTETWTIVWVPDDEPERQSSTTMQWERHGCARSRAAPIAPAHYFYLNGHGK